jgi:uncharacterized membrane protein
MLLFGRRLGAEFVARRPLRSMNASLSANASAHCFRWGTECPSPLLTAKLTERFPETASDRTIGSGSTYALALLAPAVFRDRPQAWLLWGQQWKYALLVGAISPVSYVLVLYAMQVAPLSHVAPAREVSMMFAALIGGHLLGEGDRLQRALGAALIALGVMALALG